MRGSRNRNVPTPVGVMLAIGLAACASAGWAQDGGACVTANVPAAFTLPDGTVHPAGKLTLCTALALSPVVGLHRARTQDGSASFAMSRRSRAEEYADSRPVLLFRHAPGGALDLVGYVVPFDRKAWRYELKRSDGNGFGGSPALATSPSTGQLVTLLASGAD